MLFPYSRAAIVLAHGELFGKKAAIELYKAPSGTYDRWKNRRKEDNRLDEMANDRLGRLADQFQDYAIDTAKKSLQLAQIAFKNHPFSKPPQNNLDKLAWAKSADSLSKLIKSTGDLATVSMVFNDENDEG